MPSNGLGERWEAVKTNPPREGEGEAIVRKQIRESIKVSYCGGDSTSWCWDFSGSTEESRIPQARIDIDRLTVLRPSMSGVELCVKLVKGSVSKVFATPLPLWDHR